MKYFVRTFGCQANQADSERIAGYLELQGYKPVSEIAKADLVVFNTCSVRQSAEDRVLGLIRNLVKTKLPNSKQKIILTGCMLRLGKDKLKEKLPQVTEFWEKEKFDFKLPTKREDKRHAWVPIMEGCNKFCSYCVVPYARGREKSRPFEEIVCEVEELARRGYKEITLLGQNVNDYGLDFTEKDPKLSFVLLLEVLCQIKNLQKIKFLTSNPWNFSDELIEVIAQTPKIDHYLHLPVQSGDDEILRRMNRGYTVAEYKNLIVKIRARIPKAEIGTDIIVGFPGETKKQFEKTVKLCRETGFSVAYIARYSPRPQTAAYKFVDDVPTSEKKRRFEILNRLINKKYYV